MSFVPFQHFTEKHIVYTSVQVKMDHASAAFRDTSGAKDDGGLGKWLQTTVSD